VKEENYFFRLSKYGEKILTHIESNPDFIQPEGRRNEIINFIKRGLRDMSISRPGLRWGIDIPGDPTQKAWVWFDALINYLIASDYWPADVHLIAKDILRFHCIIWPGMLLSAGYELPKRVFAHGFLTVDGQKISKSLGNVIDPVYLSENYSTDALRYFLVRQVSFGQDGDFSEASLRARLNDELADVLGNFVHRALTFTKTRYGGKVPEGTIDKEFETGIRERVSRIEQLLEDLKITQAVEEIMSIAKRGNEYFQSHKPWESVAKDPASAASCLLNCVNLVKVLCVLIAPFMPTTSSTLASQLKIEVKSWEQAKSFDLPAGHEIGKPSPLFKKVERPKSPNRVPLRDFQKLDLRVGEVVSAEHVPGTEKLLKLEVKIGEEKRTLIAGIADQYSPGELKGKLIVTLANLEPAKFRGLVSDGMLLAADDDGKVSLLTLDRPVKPGSKVK
jgi:methionyl-tRNA synthetase